MSDAPSGLRSDEGAPSGLLSSSADEGGDEARVTVPASSDSDGAGSARELAEGCVAVAPCGWAVGLNAGDWVHGLHAPLSEQSQVLVANVCANARRLGVAWGTAVFQSLRAKVAPAHVDSMRPRAFDT